MGDQMGNNKSPAIEIPQKLSPPIFLVTNSRGRGSDILIGNPHMIAEGLVLLFLLIDE